MKGNKCNRVVLATAIVLAIQGIPSTHAQAAPPTAAATTPSPAVRHFEIPAQPLAQAVMAYARQAGIDLYIGDAALAGHAAVSLNGDYNVIAALDRLLAGSGVGYRYRQSGNGARLNVQLYNRSMPAASPATAPVTDAQGAIVTGALSVAGARNDATGAERDVKGYDDVYDQDISSSYIGRAEVERYKGTTPSDLLEGIPGVFSGDARNSGALDLNIRGIQGPGRVPVTIDGTEQALTVWRGYNGATNRNYIDPFLIGGVQILKGPSLTRNVTTGIGGAMVVNTLDVDDILKSGQTFGGNFRVEGSSNSVDPRLPTLHTGEDYRNVSGYPQTLPAVPYTDKTLVVNPKTGGGGYNVFNGGDHAYRLALGWRPSDRVDLLAAYAYRERGNYYSGKNSAGYYSNARSSSADDYIRSMANYWLPGNEVPNTSSQTESWLFKASWRPTDDQALQFGYRSSLSHYGEIMPSRIIESEDRGAIQWPESRVDAKAYNLEYKWRPGDSRWIDLYANLWRTYTISDTYTAGGFPNYAQGDPQYGYDPIIKNTALANANSGRDGITFSNKYRLADSLDLTVGGSAQYEKLTSNDPYFGTSDGWRMYPRAGRRQERQGYFNVAWRPVSFLTLTAGARYSSYWAYDDFLKAHEGEIGNFVTTGYDLSYTTIDRYTQAEREAFVADQLAMYKEYIDYGIITQKEYDEIAANIIATAPTAHETNHELGTWKPDADGNYTKASNPCLNGSLNGVTNIKENVCTVMKVGASINATARHRRDHGWVPFYSATVNFSDYSRAYLRYGETLRYPSMFESTVAFSAALNPWDLKPEHAYNWELGYVHDLSHFFREGTLADVKLAWYSNVTHGVIERDPNFKFDNIDSQTIRGLDLQGRYDNGRFFTDLAVNYQLEDKVCDESTAALLSTTNSVVLGGGRVVPNCVDYGFVGGYLLTQATPKLSASWSLGGRFFERRLELGGRITYYKQYKNADLDWFRKNSYTECITTSASCTGYFVYTFNVPFSWGRTLLVDAYANYKIRDNLSAELTVTNLTDQYYVDPATRSAVAAPGRTLKLSLSASF